MKPPNGLPTTHALSEGPLGETRELSPHELAVLDAIQRQIACGNTLFMGSVTDPDAVPEIDLSDEGVAELLTMSHQLN